METIIKLVQLLQYLPELVAFLHEVVVTGERLTLAIEHRQVSTPVQPTKPNPQTNITTVNNPMTQINNITQSEDFKRIEAGD